MIRKIKKQLQKAFMIMAISVFTLSVFLNVVDANTMKYTTYKNQKFEKQHFISTNRYLHVFYDYGTFVPGDNARIFAVSKGSKYNYVAIKYKNNDDPLNSSFIIKTDKGSYDDIARVDSINGGINYDKMASGSYSHSEGDQVHILNLNIK